MFTTANTDTDTEFKTEIDYCVEIDVYVGIDIENEKGTIKNYILAISHWTIDGWALINGLYTILTNP